MPKTNNPGKPKSFRLSGETLRKLLALADKHEAAQSTIVEIAIDRMYQQEFAQEEKK